MNELRTGGTMRFLPVNLDALLVELDDLAQTLALLASLQADPIAGVDELVPAARTLLVRFRPAAIAREALVEHLASRRLDAAVEQRGATIEIPVHYDGEDLDEVAGLTGLTRDDVVRLHTGSDFRVAFTGFAPGFAYLSGGDPRLQVPRRTTPRTRIPAGAVALAGPFSGVYPQASPGGWQIIGVTSVPMWDLSRAQPALLQPGDRVRFVDAGPAAAATATTTAATTTAATATAATAAEPAAGAAWSPEAVVLEIRRSGLQALFQDLGRHGQAGQGVSASGAMDRTALRGANRLVGNPSDAAVIEIVGGGFELVCHGEAVIAATGADGPLGLQPRDGQRRALPRHAPIALADGDVLSVGEPVAGLRTYLAARGGYAVRPVLGSCATDTLAQVGPPPIAAGQRIALQPASLGSVVGDPATPPDDLPRAGATVWLDVVLGPRCDWFDGVALQRLAGQAWQVTPQSNRVGLRLAGAEPLARDATHAQAELPSEGTALGAIQVPPSGQPVLFLADHPLTGGYPVIGCVAPHHLDRAGQVPVGASVRFRPIRDFTPTEVVR